MKKNIFLFGLFFSLFFANNVFADFDNCFSKETAELLAKKALKQYIISYCDCCAEANGTFIPAVLLYVKNTKVVQCPYDESQFSVEMEYDVSGEFSVKKGRLDGKSYKPSTESQIDNKISLNYHFFLNKNKAARIYDMIDAKNQYTKCSALDVFPSAKEVKDDKNYGKWLKIKK